MTTAPTTTTGDALISSSETVHISCCLHPDTTLCGLDAGDADLELEDDCIVCADLFDNSPEFCPRRAFCPQFVVPA